MCKKFVFISIFASILSFSNGCGLFTDTRGVNRVEVNYRYTTLMITKPGDIASLVEPLREAAEIDKTDCPLEIMLRLFKKDKTDVIFFATDSCPIFVQAGKYYRISGENGEKFRKQLKKYKIYVFTRPDAHSK
ncbi:MAG: hypothetical protein ACM3WV_05325 [Bacillota bacterium]